MAEEVWVCDSTCSGSSRSAFVNNLVPDTLMVVGNTTARSSLDVSIDHSCIAKDPRNHVQLSLLLLSPSGTSRESVTLALAFQTATS